MVLKALAQRRVQQAVEPVPFGCRRRLLQQYHTLRQQVVDPRDLHLVAIPLPGPVRCGQATAVSGAASFAWLTAACCAVLGVTVRRPHHQTLLAGRWSRLSRPERAAGQIAGGAQVAMLFTARPPQGNWRLNTLPAISSSRRCRRFPRLWCSVNPRCCTAFVVNTVGSRFSK